MQFNVDLNRQALEKSVRTAGLAIGGIIVFNLAKDVLSAARNVKQAREIKKLRKQVDELQNRVSELENKK